MTNQRVAGLVWKMVEGVPLILTHTPAKSSIEDHSVTTITGTWERKENGFSAMAKTLRDYLGIKRSQIIAEYVMRKPMESRSKEYTWYFMKLAEDTKIQELPTEIQDYNWDSPTQLRHSIDHMRAGRRHMFLQALEEGCRRRLFARTDFPFLSELVVPTSAPDTVLAS